MTTVGLEPCRTRECSCPDWVLRCVHWGGAILVLCQAGSLCPETQRPHPRLGEPYLVDEIDGFFNAALTRWGNTIEASLCSCPGAMSAEGNETVHASLPKAEAEFRRRERLLIEEG